MINLPCRCLMAIVKDIFVLIMPLLTCVFSNVKLGRISCAEVKNLGGQTYPCLLSLGIRVSCQNSNPRVERTTSI
jgi:hypothetical protein